MIQRTAFLSIGDIGQMVVECYVLFFGDLKTRFRSFISKHSSTILVNLAKIFPMSIIGLATPSQRGRTFSIYLSPLSFWLTLPRGVLSTSWCCPSRPCVVFLACVHLALFLALSLSPGNSFVSSLCDRNMLASLLWQCLTVPTLLQLC